MSIELLVVSLIYINKNHPWRVDYWDLKHKVQHDLEASYMVLLSICLLYERPHTWKGLADYNIPGATLLPEGDVLPFCAILWLSGQEELNLANIRLHYLTLCTGPGFAVMVAPHVLEYFAPMVPYLERIHQLLYGASIWSKGPYQRPDTHPNYEAFQEILCEAMTTIPEKSSPFAEIVDPHEKFYCPIMPEGQ